MATITPVDSPVLSSRAALRKEYDEKRNNLFKVFETTKVIQEVSSSEKSEEWDSTVDFDPKKTKAYIDFFEEYAPIRSLANQEPSIF